MNGTMKATSPIRNDVQPVLEGLAPEMPAL
jgi:hypothetical protein